MVRWLKNINDRLRGLDDSGLSGAEKDEVVQTLIAALLNIPTNPGMSTIMVDAGKAPYPTDKTKVARLHAFWSVEEQRYMVMLDRVRFNMDFFGDRKLGATGYFLKIIMPDVPLHANVMFGDCSNRRAAAGGCVFLRTRNKKDNVRTVASVVLFEPNTHRLGHRSEARFAALCHFTRYNGIEIDRHALIAGHFFRVHLPAKKPQGTA